MKVDLSQFTKTTGVKQDDSNVQAPKKTDKTETVSKTEKAGENSLVEVQIEDNNTDTADANLNQWQQQLLNLLDELQNLKQQEQTIYMNRADAATLQSQLASINTQRNNIYNNINNVLINLASLDGNTSPSTLMTRSGESAVTGLGNSTSSNFKYRANAAGTGKATIENARQFDDKNASEMKKIMQDAGYLYHENAWCADFVGFAIGLTYGKDNAPGDFFKTCPGYPSCGQLKSWAENNGSWTKDASTLQAGDLVIFDWDGDGKADHVGLYISNNGSTVHTIEGNTSGAAGGSCVEEKDRNPSTILGFIRLSGLD